LADLGAPPPVAAGVVAAGASAGDVDIAPAAPPLALYVHVPFCVSVCPYCDFVVYAAGTARGPSRRIEELVAALASELALRADVLDVRFGPPGAIDRPPLRSIYLGGGTPSLLSAADVAALLARAASRFGLAADAEVTLEANPGPGDLGDLAGFRAAGVTRLSLGAQSLDPDELRRLGRRHRAEDVRAAVRAARRAGIRAVSVDLLYDIPGQSEKTWEGTLAGIVDLGVDHVSAYALTLDDPEAEGLTGPLGDHLPVRAGARRWRERARLEQDEDRAADLYERAERRFRDAGLEWYEVSNWARPGLESRHNLVYWRHEPYEAVGPGAHAYDGGRRRRWNAASLGPYLAALAPADGSRPRLPPGGGETLDRDTLQTEEAILGLRLRSGLGRVVAARPGVAAALAWGRAHGLVDEGPGGAAVLTLRGRLLANALFERMVGQPQPTAEGR